MPFDFVQVRLLILPNLEPYMHLLEPEMQFEKQKNEMRRHEAWRVYGALLVNSHLQSDIRFCLVKIFMFTAKNGSKTNKSHKPSSVRLANVCMNV